MTAKSSATVSAFIAKLSAERRPSVERVRDVVRRHLPAGYEEVVSKNMLVYQVPLKRYSDTYNGHLMAVYADVSRAQRLRDGFRAAGKKLDMGKACIHFRTADDLPLDVIGELVGSVTVDRWVEIAQRARRR
jgi:hypothetical protein